MSAAAAARPEVPVVDSGISPSGFRYPYALDARKPRRRRKTPIGTVRSAKVHSRSYPLRGGYFDCPLIRLSGLWLEDAGFSQGQPFEVEVSAGRLVLRAT